MTNEFPDTVRNAIVDIKNVRINFSTDEDSPLAFRSFPNVLWFIFESCCDDCENIVDEEKNDWYNKLVSFKVSFKNRSADQKKLL